MIIIIMQSKRIPLDKTIQGKKSLAKKEMVVPGGRRVAKGKGDSMR